MKTIFKILLLFVCVSTYGQFGNARYNKVTSNEYVKGSDTLSSTGQTANQIKDSLDARGIVEIKDGILKWDGEKYVPYSEGGSGLLSSGTAPSEADSNLSYGGNFWATNFSSRFGNYTSYIDDYSNVFNYQGSILKIASKNYVKLRPFDENDPFLFRGAVAGDDNAFSLYNDDDLKFSVTGDGLVTAFNYKATDGVDSILLNFPDGLKMGDAVQLSKNDIQPFTLTKNAGDLDNFLVFQNGANGLVMKGSGRTYLTGLKDSVGSYNISYDPSTNEIYASKLPHAFMYFSDSTRAIELTSSASWYHVSNTGKNLWEYISEVDVDFSNDTIILNADAHWQFHYHVVFQGTNNTSFFMRLYNVTKAQEIPIRSASTGSGTNRFESIGNTAYCVFCEEGDKVVLQVNSTLNSQTFTVYYGSVLIKATHGN